MLIAFPTDVDVAVPSLPSTGTSAVRRRGAGTAGSRNGMLGPKGDVDIDAVSIVHDHCAVYTGPETVNILLDLVGWNSSDITRDCKLLEPACGDGSFLLPAVERLLDWAQVQRVSDHELAPMIRAYEFELTTVGTLREAIKALLLCRGWRDTQAAALAETWVKGEDFLLAKIEPGYTHVVGNPPYMRWSLVPQRLRELYEDVLPRSAARGDLCLAFLWKASCFADTDGAQIGFLCADRWLRCAYGRDVRAAFALSHGLRVHIEVHGVPVFKGARKVGAYAAVTVLERGDGDAKSTFFGKATSLDELARLAQRPQSMGKEVPSIWSSHAGGGAWLASAKTRTLLEAVDVAPVLAVAGVTVRCGTALGLARAFVVDADADIEAEHLLPYLRSRDLGKVGTLSPLKCVVNVWASDGSLVDLESSSRLKRHLSLFQAELRRRACVADGRDWYRTIDKIDMARVDQPKLLVAGMSRRARIALDHGGHVVANGLYCLTSASWPLDALAAVLRAGVLDLFGEVLSPRFSGGTKRFDGNMLRQVRLPLWETVSTSLRRRITRRGDDPTFDPALLSDLYRLETSAQRSTMDDLLREIDSALSGENR